MVGLKVFIACHLIKLSSALIMTSIINDIFFPKMDHKVNSPSDLRLMNGEAVLDFIGLVTQHGYPAQEHRVTTPDGYQIVFHRIPDSPKAPRNVGKPVVYLQHGFLSSSDTWVILGPEHDLAFLMADAGYDVWVGNIRGNTYCRSHVTLDPDDHFNHDFWNFSFHEMAVLDVPTMIDYILATTGKEKLVYIGHSMGTTISYVLLSEKPEYNDKIGLVISLAPVAFWQHEPGNLEKIFRRMGTHLVNILDRLHKHEILRQNPNNAKRAELFCSDDSPWQNMCAQAMIDLFGYNPDQLNKTIIPKLFQHSPAGGSVKTIRHFLQNSISGNLQKYDYDYFDNFYIYGQRTPPEYDVRKITAPVALCYGTNDPISTKTDSEELTRRLPNVVTMVELQNFGHADFQHGENAKIILFDQMIYFISNFINNYQANLTS